MLLSEYVAAIRDDSRVEFTKNMGDEENKMDSRDNNIYEKVVLQSSSWLF
jgi:hypothetical protein